MRRRGDIKRKNVNPLARARTILRHHIRFRARGHEKFGRPPPLRALFGRITGLKFRRPSFELRFLQRENVEVGWCVCARFFYLPLS